jgi:hypothetical protein
MLIRKRALDYAEVLVALSHGIRKYRKAILANEVDTVNDLASEINRLSEDLMRSTKAMSESGCLMDDTFHKNFKDAIFRDDTPIHIWREAWIMGVESCVSIVKRRAAMFDSAEDDKSATNIEALIQPMRGTYEDNK